MVGWSVTLWAQREGRADSEAPCTEIVSREAGTTVCLSSPDIADWVWACHIGNPEGCGLRAERPANRYKGLQTNRLGAVQPH